jgi:hypothetical protein
MNGLLTHMHVTVEAIREALASMDTATLESWRPTDGAKAASAETFLAALVVEEIARRIGGGKPRLTLVVDNENGGPF